MRPIEFAATVCVLAITMAGPAQAAPAREFSIPAGPLDQSIRILAQQGGIDIGSAEPDLASVRAPAIRIRTTPDAALARLLRNTAFEATALDQRSYRITRRRENAARRIPTPSPQPRSRITTPVHEAEADSAEIVVTASKTQTSLLRFPGSVLILPNASLADLGSRAGPGFSDAAAALPILQTTGQGAGRDKVFVRAVADSSFLGPTQSTATVYFGDVQVGYNGPDPNLSLYDVARIEVLEGPQGTLYGAGAIGGIIRIEPHAPDLYRTTGHLSAGATATRSGEAGYDGAAMLNLPLVRGTIGLRAVVYRTFDGGYIDEVQRGRDNVNDTTTSGGRLAARAVVGGWTLDAGIVGQRIHAADLQYAQRGLPRLSRESSIDQPFSQKYILGRMVATREWEDGLRLLVATGLMHSDSTSRLDATRRGPRAIAYDVREHSQLRTHEARLSRAGTHVRWLGGISLVRADDRYTRTLGPLDQQRDIVGVANRATLAAVFGEATIDVLPRFAVTLGGRATHARIDGDPIGSRRPGPFLLGRTSNRLDPTIAGSWLVGSDLAAFARFQSGFRTGGIAVAPGVGRVANFDADTLKVTELGLRKQRSRPRGLAGSITLSTADWDRVQADLISRNGFPYTANIGSARIRAVELNGDWIPATGWRFGGALFLNHSRIIDPAPSLDASRGSSLPMSPAVSSSATAEYGWLSAGRRWTLNADLRQVGRSRLGTQPPLDLSQRGYVKLSAGAGVTLRHGLEFTVRIDNLLNAQGDRYASGNSFGILARDQYTPLRPRSVRIGVAIPLLAPSAGT